MESRLLCVLGRSGVAKHGFRRIGLGLSVSIFGLGYVGSVSAACFAAMGHKVIGVDVSREKVEMLDSGRTPIIEARMSELVAEANKACRLHATTDATEACLLYTSDAADE